MEAEAKGKATPQAFGSPGGKSYLASKIVAILPPHDVYTESFAGGAAVFFKKPPSDIEVLSDKDTDIAFAFRFLRNMTPEQYARLQRYDWVKNKDLFYRLKKSKPKDDVERFRRFYYLKKGSYGKGGTHPDLALEGKVIGVANLWKVHERLKRVTVHGGDAIAVIRKHDSPTTLHFVDPPYPGRAFVGATEQYTEADLLRLIEVLKGIRGKFILTLGTEHAKLLPKSWHIKKVGVRRFLTSDYAEGRPLQYEIIATNFKPLAPYKVAFEQPARIIRRPSRKTTGRRSRQMRKGKPSTSPMLLRSRG